MKSFIVASILAPTLPAVAQDLSCQAVEQCRGDAVSMCAPSTLKIDATQVAGNRARLWIDGQGPYAGRVDGDTITLENFNGRYRLTVGGDGAFVYTGNRGKRYAGKCKGQI